MTRSVQDDALIVQDDALIVQDDALCHAPDIYVWDHQKVNTEILHKNVQDDAFCSG
ncbi:hypothetical protein BMS3Bbin04_00825 [bacterium BMS3Bbin04]|nr:hypothetical protein BMS3Bbin04_00825 [bacterium BMS3Bbin04]